jgi:hypothetical protein
MFRVLWIDDQPDKLPNVIEEAKELYDIELIICRFRSEGIRELEKPNPQYDAVVLDAFLVNESISEIPAKKHLIDILNRLHQLKGMNIHIPYLVFSANAGTLMADQTFMELTAGIPVFQKTVDETPMMFLKLVEMIKNRSENELKFYYGPALELCTSKYIGESYNDYLKPLLRLLEDKTQILDTTKFRNSLRYILEGITSKFQSIGIIPISTDKLETGLNWECNILMGKAQSYASEVDILPPLVCHILDNVLKIAQDTMHDKPGLSLKVNAYLREKSSRHLICGTVLYLVEIMQYCKKIFDEFSNYDENKTIVQKNIGQVKRDDSFGKFTCENFSGKYLLTNKNIELKDGDRIIINEWEKNRDLISRNQFDRVTYKYKII